jgi:hypothetical protein
MARARSLAIMIRLRSKRSSSTPANGPMVTAGTARANMIPVTTKPECVISIARANTAMLLE